MTDGDVSPVAGEVASKIHRIQDRSHLMMNKIPIKLRATDQSTRSVNSCQNGIGNV